MLNHLKQASYEALRDETFQVTLDDGNTVNLQLTRVDGRPDTSPKYDSFAIEFQGPHTVLLPQRLWPLSHDRIGTITLFLVPVEEVADGYIYQSVFNVAKDEEADRV